MAEISDERASWLARHVLPLEPALRAWLRSKRTGGLDVDDVIQETYAILAAKESVDEIKNPRAYTFQIAYSVVIDDLRKQQVAANHAVADLELQRILTDFPSPERSAADREELALVGEVIGRMPEMCRKVFVLRRVEGLPQRAIAERLGISESTVEKHVSRGIELMMEAFGGSRTTGGKGIS